MGGSSGINMTAACLLAKQLGPGHRIVSFLCDSGSRYASKIYNKTWLDEKNFDVSEKALAGGDFIFS